MPLRHIVVIDPNPFFRDGICGLLDCDAGTTIHASRDLSEVLPPIKALHPPLAVLGPNLAEHETLATCRDIQASSPGTKAVILAQDADDLLFQIDAIHAGAAACVPANLTREEFLAAVAAVTEGHQLFSREVLTLALAPVTLSPREREVVKLMAEGRTDKQIARVLVVSVSTVRTHAERILEKLSVHDRRAAVRRARRRGLL